MRKQTISIALIILLLFTGIPNAFAYTTLKEGSRGSEVAAMQQRLIDLGYLGGRADGIFGKDTKSAVISFQKNSGLAADGIAGTRTLNALFAASAKPAGSSGQSGSGNQPATGSSGNTSGQQSPASVPIQRTLKLGSRGSDVAALQNRLNELKYNAGKPDGIFGEATKKAVIAFQKDKGLAADGIVGTKTIAALFTSSAPSSGDNNSGSQTGSNPSGGASGGTTGEGTIPITTVLKKGSRGNEVVLLQQRLNKLGYNCGAADGIFGQGTYNAVVAFQKANGLTADGIVGAKTAAKLFSSQSGSGGSTAPAQPTPPPVSNPDEDKAPLPADSLKGKIIIIDPGHGGVDSGASHGGYYEKNLALDMGLRLRRLLEQAGATVLMTRSDDRYVSLYYRSAFANKTVIDMEKKDIAEKRDGALNAVIEKQILLAEINADSNILPSLILALYQLRNDSGIYELQYGIKAQQAVQMLTVLQSDLQPLKDGLMTSGVVPADVNMLELSLADISALLEPLNETEQGLKTALTSNIADLAGLFGINQTIGSLEAKLSELSISLMTLAADAAQAEALFNTLSAGLRLSLNPGGLPLMQRLGELDAIISLLDSRLTETAVLLQTVQSDILKLNTDIEAYSSALTDLNRKLAGFMEYLNNPTLNSRKGIYEAVHNGDLKMASKDLAEVMDLTRQKYQDNMIMVAIHLNAVTTSVTKVSGHHVFYRDNQPDSWDNVDYYKNYNAAARIRLASLLLNGLNANAPFSQTHLSPRNDDFSVLRENNLVSALVEVGFMSNPDDLQKVAQPAFRENAAYGMAKGILSYFSNK